MNKNFIKIFAAFFAIVVLGALSACDSEPRTPSDERNNKLHEDPLYATYTLTEARLKNLDKFEQNPSLADLELTNNTQTIEWETSQAEGWHITPSSPNKDFKVKSIVNNPNLVYVLRLEYRNVNKESMNYQFINNNQDKIHQHFFSLYAGRIIKDPSKLPYQYKYADTNPLDDDNGVFIGDKNPLGFKGIIRFTKAMNFSINIDLIHAYDSKYDSNGALSPFYAPNTALLSNSTKDIAVKIPIEITD